MGKPFYSKIYLEANVTFKYNRGFSSASGHNPAFIKQMEIKHL